MQSPHFAFDADVGSILVSSLPPAASVWEVFDALQASPGFCTAAWTAPAEAEKGLGRDLHARFESAAAARTALVTLSTLSDDLLGNKGLTSGSARLSLLTPSPELSAMVLPPEMSNRKRLAKDEALSSQVIKHLDSLMGVPAEVTEAVLGFKGSVEFKLDLQVLYLRRVHHFCFYSAMWCKDEWSLRSNCGVAILREGLQAGPPEDAWATAHEQRLEDFLSTATLRRPEMPSTEDSEPGMRIPELYEEQILKVSEGKYRCKVCGKHFRAPEFVQKHLYRHTDLLESHLSRRSARLQEAATAAYLGDPERPSGLTLKSGPVKAS
eukprot:TRINITY_DN67765_c0_g1_i1.p1 TRINITY_DN67765_c0_g1~~TRINITY_DN67765_c0_g1_i1.p1  ORF type:complete len:323 (+),score=76.56 TRINITY_DN67765_c0_g1_i1:2-970(+)